jgi:DNA polymerase I-like protein with 3'-5' exonuclease and polymerase domains
VKLLTIDFETQDPYISRGLGAGWVYSVNNIEGCDFEVLGAAIRDCEGVKVYLTCPKMIKDCVDAHDALIMHNASYDLGCLHAIGIDVKDKPVYDTEIMSRLYDSSLMSHSLDACAKLYVKGSKLNSALTDAIVKNDLYPWLKREEAAQARAIKKGEEWTRERPPEAKLVKWAKCNMKLIQETDFKAMSDYAIGDIDATWDVFCYLRKRVDMKIALKYSMLAHICIQYRIKGVRVDMDRARSIRDEMIPLIAGKYTEVYKIAGEEFNLSSIIDVPRIFDKVGIEYPMSEKGNPSVTTPWMAKQTHPLCKAIIEARKAIKIDRDFVQKIMLMQEFTCPDAEKYGRVYPELHLLRARTGRFSCTNPNLQQIPSRDPVFGPLCRSMFVPEEGDTWYSLDFSNQEGRLQVHYAYLLKCEGAKELRDAFLVDPKMDMHGIVAEMAGVTRTEAKVINLGISYGMGIKTLANSLNSSEKAAIVVREKYNKLAPFLKQLNEKCQEAAKKRGSIKTLGGRFSRIDAPVQVGRRLRTFEYKALNKLIQGSAADQTIECMIRAYDEDLPVMFPIHDELVMSGTLAQAERLQWLMENALPLEVPTIVDFNRNGGNNWSEAK